MRRYSHLLFLMGVLLLLSLPAYAQEDDLLHVPSPDWRDQIIYFVMIDRFNDGDPTNNDMGAGEYDPEDFRKFQGGDLQGIIDQLDYIQGMGATSIWITPPVANQWWDPQVQFGGYHGYWAENFMEVDPHFGTLETYQALSRALHGREMYLIQDIVANHTGNFFSYGESWNPDDPTDGVTFNADTVPVTRPSQAPFDLNDPTNPDHLAVGIYNWTPPIVNYDDPIQTVEWQLSELDDLNTLNPQVQDALKESYTYWIETVGVDGFRIDTVKHVEHEFWRAFMHDEDGVVAAARATGREDFLAFGEVFIGSDLFSDSGERQIARYLGTPDAPELNSVLNFPMFGEINRVFAEGAPAAAMTYRLDATQAVFEDPAMMPVFIDNHDVERFLGRGSVSGLKQAMLFMMTTPGIPVIYQGTEQAFTDRRPSMFAEGWGSGGVDHFDTQSDMYQFVAQTASLRRSSPLFSRGALETLYGEPSGAGVLAYTREYEGERVLVIFNTADRAVVMQLASGLPEGRVLENVFGIVSQDDFTVGAEGILTRELAAREGLVLRITGETVPLDTADVGNITLDDAFAGATLTDDFTVSGTVSAPNTPVKIVLNGGIAEQYTTTADASGAWSVTFALDQFPLGQTANSVSAFAPELGALSESIAFETDVELRGEPVTVSDAVGDDSGPYGIYLYPQDATFTRQMDITEARYTVSGANLLVEFDMAEISTVWNPANGFDHVVFNLYIDVPHTDGGASVLPNLNASFTEEFTWDYLAFVEGWNVRLFSADGAAADSFGTNINPVPSVEVVDNTVRVLFSGAMLGNPQTLDGVRMFVGTWDWNGVDGVYRDLKAAASQWDFGGANRADGFPMVMDALTLGWEPTDGSALVLDAEKVALYSLPVYAVTVNVSVPEGTPPDDVLYLTGAFNGWNPADPAYALERLEDGTYTYTLPAREGETLAFRITRGSFLSAEKLDPNSRVANHELAVNAETTLDLVISGWWDD